MGELFTTEQAAQLAGINLLDLLDMIDARKVKPSASARDSEGERFYFSRQDVRVIQQILAGNETKSPPLKEIKPSKPLKAWSPKADSDLHYTPTELSRAWELSVHTIRRLFEDESGVMKIGEPNPKRKRRYVTMRIPQAVAVRVYRKLSS
jgi:hypothetical protein